MTLKSSCATLIAIVAMTAPIFAFPAVRAATPGHPIGIDGKLPLSTPVNLDAQSLVVHLNADGSLIVSQRNKAGGTPITLPSIQALPAEIDTLVPRSERKKLAIAVDATVPYRSLLNLMTEVRNAGFDTIGILESGKGSGSAPSEQVVRLQPHDPTYGPDTKNGLFISLGEDGTVILQVGLRPDVTRKVVKAAGAADAAAGMVPKSQLEKDTYLRADFEVTVGNVFQLLRELHATGFTDIDIVGEDTGD